MEEPTHRQYFEFDGYYLDPDQRQLRGAGGRMIQLNSRAFDVLAFLIEHRGEVIGKDVLMQAVWSRVVVDENNLNQAVSSIRRALGETPGDHRYIITIPGRGYQFVATVRVLHDPPPVGDPVAVSRRPVWLPRAVIGVLTLSIIAAVLMVVTREDVPPRPEAGSTDAAQPSSALPSLAVLPFVDISPDRDQGYFADGLSGELLNGLSHIKGLQVTSQTSAFSFRDQGIDAREIGRRLGVGYILEGSVKLAGERIRISAQLIDTGNGMSIWSDSYDRSMSDIFDVQDDISENIILALRDTLQVGNQSHRPVATRNPEAYLSYLRAQALLRNLDFTNKGRLEQASDYLQSAVRKDPDFTDAYVRLCDTDFRLASWYGNNHQEPERVKMAGLAQEACKTALAREPESSEALRAQGMISTDPEQKKLAFRRAIAANPNNVEAYLMLVSLLFEAGNFVEGSELARKAHEIDPLNPYATHAVARVLAAEGKPEESSEYFRLAAEQLQGGGPRQVESRGAVQQDQTGKPVTPRNLDFEQDGDSWVFNSECADRYEFSYSGDAYEGKQSGHLAALSGSTGWCNIAQLTPAGNMRGKYLHFTGRIRTRGITNYAKLWLRADGPSGPMVFTDGAPNYLRQDVDWTLYDLRMFVPMDARTILYGGVLAGNGEMWMDDFHLEVSDTPAPL